MCKLASFVYKYRPTDGSVDLGVFDLESHSNTQEGLNLRESAGWYEGHYIPSGEIECRTPTGLNHEAMKYIKEKWPTFDAFIWGLFKVGDLPFTKNPTVRQILFQHNVNPYGD